MDPREHVPEEASFRLRGQSEFRSFLQYFDDEDRYKADFLPVVVELMLKTRNLQAWARQIKKPEISDYPSLVRGWLDYIAEKFKIYYSIEFTEQDAAFTIRRMTAIEWTLANSEDEDDNGGGTGPNQAVPASLPRDPNTEGTPTSTHGTNASDQQPTEPTVVPSDESSPARIASNQPASDVPGEVQVESNVTSTSNNSERAPSTASDLGFPPAPSYSSILEGVQTQADTTANAQDRLRSQNTTAATSNTSSVTTVYSQARDGAFVPVQRGQSKHVAQNHAPPDEAKTNHCICKYFVLNSHSMTDFYVQKIFVKSLSLFNFQSHTNQIIDMPALLQSFISKI